MALVAGVQELSAVGKIGGLLSGAASSIFPLVIYPWYPGISLKARLRIPLY